LHADGRQQEYVQACSAVTTLGDLKNVMQKATCGIYYDCFELAQHVDLTKPPRGTIVLSTFHPVWIARVIERRYFRFDPVYAASCRASGPFGWGCIPKLIRMTDRQKRVMSERRRFGLVDGLAVPLHVAGRYRATCTFTSVKQRGIDAGLLAAAQVIATFGYQAALRIVHGNCRPRPPPRLTRRQIECIDLSIDHSEPEIGRVLNLSHSTVHSHLQEAMRRAGVRTAKQLLHYALRNGLISFGPEGPFEN
jgi:LuxR family quorum-sensing system transcriptional regulator CciR